MTIYFIGYSTCFELDEEWIVSNLIKGKYSKHFHNQKQLIATECIFVRSPATKKRKTVFCFRFKSKRKTYSDGCDLVIK